MSKISKTKDVFFFSTQRFEMNFHGCWCTQIVTVDNKKFTETLVLKTSVLMIINIKADRNFFSLYIKKLFFQIYVLLLFCSANTLQMRLEKEYSNKHVSNCFSNCHCQVNLSSSRNRKKQVVSKKNACIKKIFQMAKLVEWLKR